MTTTPTGTGTHDGTGLCSFTSEHLLLVLCEGRHPSPVRTDHPRRQLRQLDLPAGYLLARQAKA